MLNLNEFLTIDFNKQKKVAYELVKCCVWTIQICKKEDISKLCMIARGHFLSMVLGMNVLNGSFYKRDMFQLKYHWIEIKYLGAIQNQRQQPFADVIMHFLNMRLAFTLMFIYIT